MMAALALIPTETHSTSRTAQSILVESQSALSDPMWRPAWSSVTKRPVARQSTTLAPNVRFSPRSPATTPRLVWMPWQLREPRMPRLLTQCRPRRCRACLPPALQSRTTRLRLPTAALAACLLLPRKAALAQAPLPAPRCPPLLAVPLLVMPRRLLMAASHPPATVVHLVRALQVAVAPARRPARNPTCQRALRCLR